METEVSEGFSGQIIKVVVAALFLAPAAAHPQATREAAPFEPILPFTQFILDNGLTLIVREDRKLPIVSVEVVYQVGSRNDPPGKSGLAHLFEHLLFYGSQHHPHNFLVAMQRLGGTNVNGGTGPDLTTGYQTVPVSQLDAALWLESDRMGYLLPALTQKTLDEQVELIRNEINMGLDEPGGEVRYRIAEGVFPPDHPYHHEPVGDRQELGNITLDDARNFFRTYYAPSNAAVVIAGDISPGEALEKVTRYFGGLPTGPRPGLMTAWVPELSEDKRERIFDASSPKLFLSWPMPRFGTTDDILLRLVGSILADGDSSRLKRRLSAAGLDASDLSWYAGANAMAGVFGIIAVAGSPTEFRAYERLIREEIATLAEKGPTREELERAQRGRLLTLRRLAQRTADSNGQADLLANNWGLGDRNAGLLDANLREMLAVTPAEVSAAARRWLERPAHILELEPAPQYRTSSADVDRSRMPAATTFKPANFPKIQVTTLPNGLKVGHAQWQGGPVVVTTLIVRGGAGVDPQDKAGLGRLTASLLTAGAGAMSEDDLADALARIEATLEATTDLDALTLTLVAPKEQMKAALELFGNVVATPTFPDVAVEREKKKQLQELPEVTNAPRLLSRATVRRLLYGAASVYAGEGSGLGTTSGVSKITRADVAGYHAQWFNPTNSEIVVVGDIGQAEAESLLAVSLGRWNSTGSQAPVVSVPAKVAAPGIYLIDRPGQEQADITVATLLDAPASPANPANAVMTTVLGDSTGRVNQDLRERKHWAYWVGGTVEGGRAGQMMLIRTQVQPQLSADAIAAIKGHLEGMKGGTPISADELQLAKDTLTLSLPLQWETDEGIASAIATSARRGLPDGAMEKFVTDVRAVTRAQVEQAARRVLRPEAMVWVIIGDQSKVEPQLQKAGITYKVLTPET
jgi:zinc protease